MSALIQTTTRLITVKETYEEIYSLMDFQWLEVTEDMSFYGEITKQMHFQDRKIRLNKDYIVEVHPHS